MMDPRELVAIAEAAVDQAEPIFRSGIGAPPAHFKSRGDFATEVDLTIEKQLRDILQQMTGIPVYGEESGGSIHDTVWVVDPIDGTANYSAGNPMAGILVALVHEGQPVVAISDFPLLGRRLVASDGSPLRSVGGPSGGVDGGKESPEFDEARGHVGCSSYLPTAAIHALRDTGLRPRMTGSVGLDNAFVAQGVFDGAVNFSPHPWDNAAGALLVKAAGGIVTDPEGNPWTAQSRGMVSGTPQVHEAILKILSHHLE